jgi:hypothetical protein
MVYSLLGISSVYMPLIYGEGKENALKRLKKEIHKSSTNQSNQRSNPSLNVSLKETLDP